MKFLIDQPVSPMLARWLRSGEGGGHDALHARERNLSTAPDTRLVALAMEESRILVTADLDFARIIALSGRDGPGLILFRAGNVSDAQMLVLLQRVLLDVPHTELPRSVVVIDENSIRVASLPIKPAH